MFSCVEEARAVKLVNIANQIKAVAKPQPSTANDHELAGEWGLSENIYEFLPDILYYQTRHYKHAKRAS